jgi:hypothetical protein
MHSHRPNRQVSHNPEEGTVPQLLAKGMDLKTWKKARGMDLPVKGRE